MVSADNSVHVTRTAAVRSPSDSTYRPSGGGIAAHVQQVDAMLADAEKEYQACRRVRIEEAIAAKAKIETLQAVRQSANINLLRGGV